MPGNSRKLVKTICSVSFAALLPAGMSMAADSTSNPSASSAAYPALEEQRLDALDAATNAFGVDSTTITTVGPQDFIAWTGTTIQDVPGLTRSISEFTIFGEAYAPINFPSGALVTYIELEACDDSDTGSIGFRMVTCPGATESCPTNAQADTGVSSAFGCGYTAAFLDPPVTIDNFNNTYMVRVDDPDLSTDTRWRAIRVAWQRQISPAPGTATFGDVPTDNPFFRAIEALASSGITSGCGGGLYCPNDPVTRAQMAVFMARALGLHFPL